MREMVTVMMRRREGVRTRVRDMMRPRKGEDWE